MQEENKNNTDNVETVESTTESQVNHTEPQGKLPFSIVASSANQKKIIVVIMMIGVVASLYFLFFQSDNKTHAPKNTTSKAEIVQQSISVTKNEDQGSLPPAPSQAPISAPPPLKEVQLPAPPPPPTPVAPPTPIITPPPNMPQSSPVSSSIPLLSASNNDKDAVKAKMSADSMVFGGGGSKDSDNANPFDKKDKSKSDKDDKEKSKNQYMGFDGGMIDNQGLEYTSSTQVVATRASRNLARTMLQGKIIEGVLETAINSDIGTNPATTRAIVSRDVYGEQGNIVLLPKGSRMIGTYSPGQTNGQTRIVVRWDRAITPTGIDISLNSLGTDPLGRAGITAYTDDHFWGQMASALMVSLIIPYFVIKATNTGNQPVNNINTNNNNDITLITGVLGGSTTMTVAMLAAALPNNATVQCIQRTAPGIVGSTAILAAANACSSSNNSNLNSGNVWGQAMSQGVSQFQNVATQAVQNRFPNTTTLIVDQGTKIAILVQQDMIFPAQAITNSGPQLLP